MRKLFSVIVLIVLVIPCFSQKPCNDSLHRQFDFWVGSWEVFGPGGKKAGDSKISLILDSCVVLEEWVSTGVTQGIRFAGKSFNTYNAGTRQWQQTWVDNTGGTTEFLQGRYEDNSMSFQSIPFPFFKDTMAIRKLSFFHLANGNVRQWGQISKDNAVTWVTEYDLEYRRKQ